MQAPVSIAAFIAAMTMGAAVAAQPAPQTPVTRQPFGGWSAAAGYETFAFRDISRNIRPPDASPIAWRGAGPVVAARYDRSRGRSSHLADVSVALARDFSYVSPVRSVAAFDADRASRFDVRYEYRRYLWQDVGVKGLEVGAGIQGVGSRVAFERHVSAFASESTRIAGGGAAGVAAVRWHYGDRLQAHASWANGAVVSRRRSAHSADPLAAGTFSGGHWLTDLIVGGDWRVTSATHVTVVWRRSFEGYSSNHYSYAGTRQSLSVGMTYAR